MSALLIEVAAASPRSTLAELEQRDGFAARHIGPDADEQAAMLAALGYPTRAALIDAVVPAGIRRKSALDLPPGRTEAEALAQLKHIAGRNRV